MNRREPIEVKWRDVVAVVAAERGFTVTDLEADILLWNYTGFPSFWPSGKTPVASCMDQLRAAFADLVVDETRSDGWVVQRRYLKGHKIYWGAWRDRPHRRHEVRQAGASSLPQTGGRS